MSVYKMEEKESFVVVGIGTELKSHYTDYAGINKEKSDFWQAVREDGRLDQLKAMATNDYIFAVNEAVNNKMMHYAGVMGEASDASEEARVIQFPKGTYIVVSGERNSFDELNNDLPAMTFGQALPEAEGFAYVGAPNTMVVTDDRDTLVAGEMWLPVVRK